eukprot:scaffold26741_cov46-Prasinocladus_malaysianus.AAC.2
MTFSMCPYTQVCDLNRTSSDVANGGCEIHPASEHYHDELRGKGLRSLPDGLLEKLFSHSLTHLDLSSNELGSLPGLECMIHLTGAALPLGAIAYVNHGARQLLYLETEIYSKPVPSLMSDPVCGKSV